MAIERGKRYSREERERLLELFAQSGLKASRFCREMGVSYPTLRRWLDRSGSGERGDGLVELVAAAPAIGLRARLPNGIEIEFSVGPEALAGWIRELARC